LAAAAKDIFRPDMVKSALERYIKKRRFDRTSEPVPKSEDTVLVSYAIPKARLPEDDEKVLMVQVEEHPVEYMHFEGEIPRDEYGGGTVKVYDKGFYKVVDADPKRMVIEFEGEKVKGKYAIVYLKDDQYLLTKVTEE
jgi:bifunctional non-homologous end joining protein LigD